MGLRFYLEFKVDINLRKKIGLDLWCIPPFPSPLTHRRTPPPTLSSPFLSLPPQLSETGARRRQCRLGN